MQSVFHTNCCKASGSDRNKEHLPLIHLQHLQVCFPAFLVLSIYSPNLYCSYNPYTSFSSTQRTILSFFLYCIATHSTSFFIFLPLLYSLGQYAYSSTCQFPTIPCDQTLVQLMEIKKQAPKVSKL